MKSVIIVPSNREQQITHFLEVWREEMANATIMIIEDNPEKTFDLKETTSSTTLGPTSIQRSGTSRG